MNIDKEDGWLVHRSPEVRTRSWDSKSPAAEYRPLKRRVSKSRCRRGSEEGARGDNESKAG